MIIYFGEEVEKALKDYLPHRDAITPLPGHENALFYSTQRRRIGVQAVENMVKKYAKAVTTTKKITPHKLRSTYGTTLYQETGDNLLGCRSTGGIRMSILHGSTMQPMDEERRRQAAKAVTQRSDCEKSSQ